MGIKGQVSRKNGKKLGGGDQRTSMWRRPFRPEYEHVGAGEGHRMEEGEVEEVL